MLLDLPTDIIYEIVEYLEKRKKRRLAPPGHFAVVGPAWGNWRIGDRSLYMLMFTNRRLHYITKNIRFMILESYYSKSRFFRKNRIQKSRKIYY